MIWICFRYDLDMISFMPENHAINWIINKNLHDDSKNKNVYDFFMMVFMIVCMFFGLTKTLFFNI